MSSLQQMMNSMRLGWLGGFVGKVERVAKFEGQEDLEVPGFACLR
jgi:hypothetical protein